MPTTSPAHRRRLRTCVAALAAVCVALVVAQTPGAAADPLTVMSFNIRYGTANDGDNHWTRRRAMVFDLVRDQKPDLIGVQEALGFQIDEIIAAVPGYAVVGVGRDDGKAAGEFSAILFRSDRLRVAESGTFWFSDTPAMPGSRSWGNRITRISTWARFIDRDGAAFWHYNLHLDHESQPSRERSTELLQRQIDARPLRPEPVVVTGDFNVGEDNVAILRLIGSSGAAVPAFVDTFRVRHRDAREVGTFTGFGFGKTSGPKIDYVLVQPDTDVLEADIIRSSRDGRYPSDHFPVVARVRLRR